MAGRKHSEKEVMKSESEEGLNTEQALKLKCSTVMGYHSEQICRDKVESLKANPLQICA